MGFLGEKNFNYLLKKVLFLRQYDIAEVMIFNRNSYQSGWRYEDRILLQKLVVGFKRWPFI